MATVKYPLYRQYEANRVRVNDALMALLVGSRLASHSLSLHGGSSVTLGDMYPAVDQINRMNQKACDVRELLDHSERHFTLMAIPYLVSVHVAHVKDVLELLIERGVASLDQACTQRNGQLTDELATIDADAIHRELIESANFDLELSEDDLDLFSLARRMRNRILHANATAGSHLRNAYLGLSAEARKRWERPAGRELPISGSSESLDLKAGELIATLAVTHQIAKRINFSMQAGMPRPTWARLAVDDYRSMSRQRFGQPDVLKRLRGFSQTHYGPLRLTDDELCEAVQEVRGS